MADTTVQPNNIKTKFRGKPEREPMPSISKAQNAAMHSAADGKSTLGIPQKVGAEFVADQAPGSVKKLPQRVSKKGAAMRKRGLISDKAAAKWGMK